MTPEELKKWAEEQILWTYLKMDATGKLVNPPKTDDELHEFIRLAYGSTLPRKVMTPGHKAPFDFVSDLFFERVKNALGFASRNGGKTWALAILNHLEMLFKAGVEITSSGSTLNQADKCYEYFQGFCALPWFVKLSDQYQQYTGRKLLTKAIQSSTIMSNGSKLDIITASEKGFRGPHPQKNRVDEIDLIEWPVLQSGLSMAAGKEIQGKTVRGQNVFTSTRQYPNGPMQRLLDEAHEKGIEIYQWNVWEVVERCTRRCKADTTYGDCPIYAQCMGKAHHCDGFYKVEDFIEKARMLDKESFDVEWKNERPERGKLIYQFDSTRHVLGPEQLRRMTGSAYPQPHWTIVSGIDFGSSPGHPFAYVKICQLPSNGAWLLFYEYQKEQDLLRNHAEQIKGSPLFRPGETIYADHDAQDRLELLNYGVHTLPAYKDVETGIDYLRSLLNGYPPHFTPSFYVWHTCKTTIREFGSYQRKLMADGTVDPSGRVQKTNDHNLDAARYAIMTGRGLTRSKYRSYSMPGI